MSNMKRREFLSVAGLSLLGVMGASIPQALYADEVVDEAPWVEIEEFEGSPEPAPDYAEMPSTRSATLPAEGAIYYLANGYYNFTLVDFGYRVYSNVWFRTSNRIIRVTLTDWTVIEDHGGQSNKVTIHLYRDSKIVQSVTKTVTGGNTYVITFHSLDTSSNYAVCFEGSLNGNRYSAHGRISQ